MVWVKGYLLSGETTKPFSSLIPRTIATGFMHPMQEFNGSSLGKIAYEKKKKKQLMGTEMTQF